MRSLRLLIVAVALAAAAPASLGAENSPAPSADALAAARDLFAVTFERAGAQLNAQAVEHTWPSLENALRARNPLPRCRDARRTASRVRAHSPGEAAGRS